MCCHGASVAGYFVKILFIFKKNKKNTGYTILEIYDNLYLKN